MCYSRGMADDKDIYRSAKLLIERHGDDAVIEAAMQADELLEAGDVDGHGMNVFALIRGTGRGTEEPFRVWLMVDLSV